MASSYTTNKFIEKPGNGDYVDTWNVPVNADMDVIDQAFGGTTSLNATGGSAFLSIAQYRSLILSISGAISASVTYTIPLTIGGQWIVFNTTTDSTGGPHSIIISSAGGGTSVTVPRNAPLMIYSDGTNVRVVPTAGSSGQVVYNSGGVLTGSSNLAFDGTTLTGNTIVSQNAWSDGIGNVRSVPANSKSSSYTLQATDNGKFISITTGGIVVPSGIFSAGQVVSVYNNSGSNQTISASGTTLRLVGTTTTGSRTLSSYGLATILCVASNTFVVTGGGVS